MRLGGVFAALPPAPHGRPPPRGGPGSEASGQRRLPRCHEDPSAKRANGSSLFVDKAAFAASVHGAAGAACVDCHEDLAKTSDFPHAEKLAPVDCSSCHASEVAEYEERSRVRTGKSKASKRPRARTATASDDILPSKDSVQDESLQSPGDVSQVSRNVAVVAGAGDLR